MANKHSCEYKDYDVVISGGGVSGCLAALALSKLPQLTIALVEAAKAPHKADAKSENNQHPTPAGFDARVIALAQQSLLKLHLLGLDTNRIAGEEINDIHVSDRGHFGQVRIQADTLAHKAFSGADKYNDYRLRNLGKVVAISDLGNELLSQVKKASNVDYWAPYKVEQINRQQDHIDLSMIESVSPLAESEQGKRVKLRAKLLINSEGANSNTAKLLNIETQSYDYEQSAVISNVSMQLPHKGIAFERFTSQGPIAFLPMSVQSRQAETALDGHAMSVVWCMKREKVNELMLFSELEFAAQLSQLFGSKLGKIVKHTKPISYPLVLTTRPNFTGHRVICIGNAAQALHPIAGQGFNLGIRDVFDLLQTLSQYDDVGCFASTNAYAKSRLADKHATISATDTLVNVFSNQHWPLVAGRNLGLHVLNATSLGKQRFADFAMGFRN